MKFDETRAIKIVSDFNLSKKTIATWKKRGAIPDRYSSKVPGLKELTALEIVQFDKIKRAFSSSKLNKSVIAQASSISPSRMNDCLRGKSHLYQHELIALKKTINEVRCLVTNFLNISKSALPSSSTEESFLKIINDPRIVPFVLFDRNRYLHAKIDGFRMNRRTYPTEIVNQINAVLLVFLAETNIN